LPHPDAFAVAAVTVIVFGRIRSTAPFMTVARKLALAARRNEPRPLDHRRAGVHRDHYR